MIDETTDQWDEWYSDTHGGTDDLDEDANELDIDTTYNDPYEY